MLRTIHLIFQNEFRLLIKDRVGLFMLILAPVIIIAVAGFSLSNLYGVRAGDQAYSIPVVDQDGGEVASAIIDALKHEPMVAPTLAPTLDDARRVVTGRARAPLAIVIPAGTTEALKAGRAAPLILYVDPIKRLEVSAIELRLSDMCRAITSQAQDQARKKIASEGGELHGRLDRLGGRLKQLQAQIEHFRDQAARGQASAERELRARMEQAAADVEAQTRAAVDRSIEQTKSALTRELDSRRAAIAAVTDYLKRLQASEHDFDRWLADLKKAAGSHAADIPPPPAFPTPPPQEQLALLSQPVELSIAKPAIPKPEPPALSPQPLPAMPRLAGPELLAEVESLRPGAAPVVPGDLGWNEESLTGGSSQINAFDQYVPGFGITFLLVAMLMGLSLGLIDDRDWGTLQRLQVSGARLTGALVGKLLSRFLIGLVQLIVLFALGWALFGTSLGPNPMLLLLPAAAISFAAAAFGLIIACVARTHDSVMPVGAVVAMAMSAIGGCWWPLDFEPAWMRSVAMWLPTTWTMQAFNDLTIRGLTDSALHASFITVGLGVIYLIAGLTGASQLYK